VRDPWITPGMGRAAILCSLLCVIAASRTVWHAFVSPTSAGGPSKVLKPGSARASASPVLVQQGASAQGVSLAAPLCLLAVAWVARSSNKINKKPLKRQPVVVLSASTRPVFQTPASVVPSITQLIDLEDEVNTAPVPETDFSFMEASVEPQPPPPTSMGRPKGGHNRKGRSSRTARRSIGARLARPNQVPVATAPSYDISKVRSKLQSGLCGRGPSRTSCRAREIRSQVRNATAQGIVVYSGLRFSIFCVAHHSEG